MICPKCQFENLPEAIQCESCGEELNHLHPENNETVEPVAVEEVFKEDTDRLADAGSNDEHSQEDADTSAKKKSGNRVIWTIAALGVLIAVLLGLGIVFRNKILKIVNPERYLQVSLGRTFSDKVGSKIFDMSKYTDQAAEYAFSVEAEEVGGELSVLYSAKDEKALFELSLDAGTDVYDDIFMYISREVIAVKIPDLLDDVEVLTIDPETFEDDFEALGLAETLPEDYIENLLDLFFAKSADGGKDSEELAEYYREAKYMEEYADFSKGKTVTERIGGKTYKLATMSYVISEEAANDYFRDALESYKQGFIDSMGSMYQEADYEVTQDAVDEVFEIFEGIYIEGDVVITYYIDGSDYVRKITMDEVEIGMHGEDELISFEFEMLLSGKTNPCDKATAVLTMGVDGEEADLGINWEQSFEKGVFNREIEFFVGVEGEEEEVIVFEMEWDTKDNKGDNFEALLTLGDGDYGSSIEITGVLKDGKSETTFKDGQIRLDDGYNEDVVIDFEFSISKIDPKDIYMDLEDSVPFFEYIDKLEGFEEISV